jgi:hypothetical protein
MALANCTLEKNSILRPLAEMLDGYTPPDAVNRDDLIPILEEIDPKLFAEILSEVAVDSPGSDKLAVCVGLMERGWVTSRKRYAGFLRTTGPESRIVGQLVLGHRDREKRKWELIDTAKYD